MIPCSQISWGCRTKRRLCLTWGFVLRGEADPEEQTGPGVYRWHDFLSAARIYDSEKHMQTGLQSILLSLWWSQARLSTFFPWLSLGGLASGTHKQGKWKRKSIIRGTFPMKWTWEDIKRDRTCAAFWRGIRFDPLRNNYVRFAAGASHSFIHHKLWTLFPSLAFLSVFSWAYPLCWALLFISRAVW